MGKKVVPKFSAYMYQWTHYEKDFNRVRNLRRKGGNRRAGERLAFVNNCLEAPNPKPHWLICGQVKAGQFRLYALCKLRAPTEEEKLFHAEELRNGTETFEKYVYIDEENSFFVAFPGDDGELDLQLDKLLQVEIGKLNGQLQGSNGLEVKIDDFYVERLKKRQKMTIGQRIRQLENEGTSEVEEHKFCQPNPSSEGGSRTNTTDPVERNTSGGEKIAVGLSETESEPDLEKITREIDEECANLGGQDVDAVVKRRVGQGVFRNRLLDRFGAACCLTGLTHLRLLVASHIVPWSESTATQKLDPDNGLLLSVSMDALFDKGLISFSSNGRILIGSDLDAEAIEILGLKRGFELPERLLTEARKKNFAKHRERHGFEPTLC